MHHINHVIQPLKNHGCYGCVAAMVTGEPFSSVADFVGHDGSKRPFKESEIVLYLWDRGFYLNSSGSFLHAELAEKTEIPKKELKFKPYYSDLMFDIACALGRNKHEALREQFDTVIKDFIQEHSVDLCEEQDEEQNNPLEGIADRIIGKGKGKDGFQLRHEIRQVLFIQAFIDTRQPAIVCVIIRGGFHALYWDGKRLFDPHYPHDVDLINYHTFISWSPVVKFNK
jgi:hypothetical protein